MKLGVCFDLDAAEKDSANDQQDPSEEDELDQNEDQNEDQSEDQNEDQDGLANDFNDDADKSDVGMWCSCCTLLQCLLQLARPYLKVFILWWVESRGPEVHWASTLAGQLSNLIMVWNSLYRCWRVLSTIWNHVTFAYHFKPCHFCLPLETMPLLLTTLNHAPFAYHFKPCHFCLQRRVKNLTWQNWKTSQQLRKMPSHVSANVLTIELIYLPCLDFSLACLTAQDRIW